MADNPIGLDEIIAHCGGNPTAAVRHIASVIPTMPENGMPYASLAALRRAYPAEFAAGLDEGDWTGIVAARAFVDYLDGRADDAADKAGALTAYDPSTGWATAPWFGDGRFLGRLTGDGLSMAILKFVRAPINPADPAIRVRFVPWFTAVEAVAGRSGAEALARMAILYRIFNRAEESLELCDRADDVEPVAFTEVVRAGTYARLGDASRRAAALERALNLEPHNWSICLDLADVRCEQGDFPAATDLAGRAAHSAPAEITPRAAEAAYRARLTGNRRDLKTFQRLFLDMPESPYRQHLAAVAGIKR